MFALVSRARPLMVAAMLLASPAGARAQRPTPDQAAAMLQARPELATRLREWIGASGLTPDQVRARLRSEGYPENLLDGYLSGGGPRSGGPEPTSEMLDAIRELGIADDSALSPIRGVPATVDTAILGLRGRPIPTLQYDTVAYHRTLPDSLVTPRVLDDSVVGVFRSVDTAIALRYRLPPPRDSGYTVFGLDVFGRASTQFDPNLAGPVDASYRLGPGDRLVLILTGDVELAHSLDVTREGFIVIPQVGQLHVANLTVAELNELLYARLGRVYSGVRRGPQASTRFSVSVSRLRTNQIYVIGEVIAPGSYRVSSAGTSLTALYAAGGPTVNGTLRSVAVRRAGRAVDTLDVYDYLLRGDATHDIRLETGDVVFVGVRTPRVRVVGEVVRPGMYEMRAGETLGDLLTAAGGLEMAGGRRRAVIERTLPRQDPAAVGGSRVVIEVPLDAGNPAASAFPLEPGDVVRIPRLAERVRNRVVVQGHVWSPGPQGLAPGQRVSEALRLAGGVKPDAYIGRILVTRLLPDSTRIQLRTALRDTTGAVDDDFMLQENDEITVFSRSDFRPERYVTVTGAIQRSGRYPFHDGMTMRDLVLMASGLEESAYLAEAEIARLPADRRDGRTAVTLRVPLDSSYVFERGPDGRYLGPPGLPAPRDGAREVPLQVYDNVLILRQPDWELQRNVKIGGEVRFPGDYALTNKTERLDELIERAGGLTAEAYPAGVVFYRRAGGAGRIGIDLPNVLRNRRAIDNLILQGGDSIWIPRFNPVVTVTGAVNSPVAVAFAPGRDIAYYIYAAGGGSRKADLRRAYVVQANGKVETVQRFSFRGNPKPQPGATVHVPEREPEDRRDYLALAGSLVQVLASLVAIVAIVER
jgi:protein involved in polysaccharide export with SLBB domain